jgi:hypothetical protein
VLLRLKEISAANKLKEKCEAYINFSAGPSNKEYYLDLNHSSPIEKRRNKGGKIIQ